MQTRHFLWGALLSIALAFSGCVKEDIQNSTADESRLTRSATSFFSLEQAKDYVAGQGNSVVAPDLGTRTTLTPLSPVWDRAQVFESGGTNGYYIPLSGDMNPILEVFGATPCSGSCGCEACNGESCDQSTCACADCHCGHDHHGLSCEGETVAISTLFIKKDAETGDITAYVQTNIRNTENIYYAFYSSLQGEIYYGSQTVDGQTTLLDKDRFVTTRSATRSSNSGYGEWCDICNIWITPGSPIAHPRCHTCLNPVDFCECGSGGGTVEPFCPICGTVGDPRCSTPQNSCYGKKCRLCNKLGLVDWEWNVRFHDRKQCESEGICRCLCNQCFMHPDFCLCCKVCGQYPCECPGPDDSLFVYTPLVDLDQLHITVPKADIQMALNELHTH